MTVRLARLAALACALAWAAPALPAPPERVDDFALLDQRGGFHELYYYADTRAVVLFVQGNGCPIARNSIPVLNALRERFEARGVVFLGLNANPQDDRASVAAEAEAYGLTFPVLLDETQLVAESLGITRTAEVLVIDPRGWRLLYRGPVDDRLDYEAQRSASRHFVREVLEGVLEGAAVELESRESPGCLIFFPHEKERQGGAISYSDDVAPILLRRCSRCHQSGGVAPWAMTHFAMVQGWSPMMREVIRTRRMPPWHADPHFGSFANALSLRPDEARRLVHWIEAGAPRGEGPDPLALASARGDAGAEARNAAALPVSWSPAAGAPPSEWPLGEPDLVIHAPEQSIPATGVVPYRYETVEVSLDRSAWLRAVDIRPSNARVVHHATAYIVHPSGRSAPEIEGPRFARGLFAGYVPGREPQPFPENAGFHLPRGARIRFQLHYTTTGKPEVDTPRIGLYLAKGELEHELKIGAALNTWFEIPAGAVDHEEVAEHRLERDIVIYRLTPHMHFRGKRMAIEAHYPDGRQETLLSVPNYNFNWQRQYVLDTPLEVPRGTRIVARAGFDNSDRNPANPDPSQPVFWGEQSYEEMLIGYFLYRDAKPPRGGRPARHASSPGKRPR